MPGLNTRREQAIGWIEFSNPAKHNALTYDMLLGLPEAVQRWERDPQITVIALRGEGDHYASGIDVTEFFSRRGSSGANVSYDKAMLDVHRAIVGSRKPTLACVRGACFGAGLSTALYCDMRVSSDQAEFSQQVTRIGLALSSVSVKRMVDLLGPSTTADLLLTGRRLGAAQALAVGMVDRVIPGEALDSAFAALAAEIGEGAPLSIAAAKLSIRAALGEEGALREAQAAIDASHASEDYVEGRRAFAQKRKPVFRGR
jgi:enoyl-CoA hydratase